MKNRLEKFITLIPVLTTVTSSAYPVGSVEFPAFTICGEGLIGDTVVAGLIKEFFNFLKSKMKISVKVFISPTFYKQL